MWCPDIRYAVNQLCTKASKPTTVTDVRKECRIIGYLLGTAQEGVCLRTMGKNTDIFTGAGEDLEENATTGILIYFFKESLIVWRLSRL